LLRDAGEGRKYMKTVEISGWDDIFDLDEPLYWAVIARDWVVPESDLDRDVIRHLIKAELRAVGRHEAEYVVMSFILDNDAEPDELGRFAASLTIAKKGRLLPIPQLVDAHLSIIREGADRPWHVKWEIEKNEYVIDGIGYLPMWPFSRWLQDGE
jgi:hypothetical protein